MILELKRATANIIENNLQNIKCFANETANELNYYPCIYISEIERKQKVFGTGKADYTKRDYTGKTVQKTKIIEYHTVLRFLIEATGFIGKSDISEKPAALQVHEIDNSLSRLFIKIKRGKNIVQFTDPETSKNLNVTDIQFVTSTDIPEEINVEPIIFRRALSYKFIHRYYFEQSIDHTIETINLNPTLIKVF